MLIYATCSCFFLFMAMLIYESQHEHCISFIIINKGSFFIFVLFIYFIYLCLVACFKKHISKPLIAFEYPKAIFLLFKTIKESPESAS